MVSPATVRGRVRARGWDLRPTDGDGFAWPASNPPVDAADCVPDLASWPERMHCLALGLSRSVS